MRETNQRCSSCGTFVKVDIALAGEVAYCKPCEKANIEWQAAEDHRRRTVEAMDKKAGNYKVCLGADLTILKNQMSSMEMHGYHRDGLEAMRNKLAEALQMVDYIMSLEDVKVSIPN
jgi:hypothetical protein